jgi:hypothetical protein
MALQMYIATFKSGYSEAASRDVQHAVRSQSGFILMVTRSGVIVALEGSRTGPVAGHPEVGMLGAVSLNPRGYAAERLHRIFLENMAKQVTIET